MEEITADIRDLERRTGLLEQRIAAHEEWRQSMERWQEQQNGHLRDATRSLREVNERIDRLRELLIGALVGLVINLALQILQLRGG